MSEVSLKPSREVALVAPREVWLGVGEPLLARDALRELLERALETVCASLTFPPPELVPERHGSGMSTDGRRLYYEPAWAEDHLRPSESGAWERTVGVLGHEMGHLRDRLFGRRELAEAELLADRHAGEVLRRTGTDAEGYLDLLVVLDRTRPVGYPSLEERQRAVLTGYEGGAFVGVGSPFPGSSCSVQVPADDTPLFLSIPDLGVATVTPEGAPHLPGSGASGQGQAWWVFPLELGALAAATVGGLLLVRHARPGLFRATMAA